MVLLPGRCKNPFDAEHDMLLFSWAGSGDVLSAPPWRGLMAKAGFDLGTRTLSSVASKKVTCARLDSVHPRVAGVVARFLPPGVSDPFVTIKRG